MLTLKTIEASENLFSDEHAKLCHGANCSFHHNLREDIKVILFSIFNTSRNLHLLVLIQVCGLLQEYRCRRGEKGWRWWRGKALQLHTTQVTFWHKLYKLGN